MLKYILMGGVLLIAAVLIFAATRPDTFRVQRTTDIAAPPDKIFSRINDLNHWAAWSPWEKKDPKMQRSHRGAASGQGAVYEWEGDSNVGKGGMQIVQSSPPSSIVIKLDFVKPFEAHNMVEFMLEPKGDSTHVTWSMTGDVPYFAKIVHLFFDMDSMVGKDFEAGLASLKSLTES